MLNKKMTYVDKHQETQKRFEKSFPFQREFNSFRTAPELSNIPSLYFRSSNPLRNAKCFYFRSGKYARKKICDATAIRPEILANPSIFVREKYPFLLIATFGVGFHQLE